MPDRPIYLAVFLLVSACSALAYATDRPNIVIVMADDMGWRDTNYAGSPHAKTPHLDAMAAAGLRFDYFYPGGQMCSPGRFAAMTGRTPIRTGLHHLGAIRPQEFTLPQALKTVGYKTAQFGKWHLGGNETSPAKMGFDEATWAINYFDLGAKLQIGDTKEFVALDGDTSVATMDLALKYIRKQAAEQVPFFTYVCFGSPHRPHQASEEFKAIYKDLPAKQQDFYGEISGLDAAVGNLRAELHKLKIADNTLVWFTSDNGGITPLSQDPAGKGKMNVGVRTVSVLEWPAKIKQPRITEVPCAHMDIYPTLLAINDIERPNQPVLDGLNLVPLFDGKMTARDKPLGFLLWNGSGKFDNVDFETELQGVWIDGKYKLIVPPSKVAETEPKAGRKKNGKRANQPQEVQLFDIFADPAHKTNLADQHPEIVTSMRAALVAWQKSVRSSFDGNDFSKK
ncbi:sulfatase family protein [Anatilimnocola aggregata]|nr:sulfatase-like hydrolase/transferase [Anatilimnocola aggregata]